MSGWAAPKRSSAARTSASTSGGTGSSFGGWPGGAGVDEAAGSALGAGVAAGRVTRALGESWLDTCEQYWLESYPQPPAVDDPQAMAEAFGDNLQTRLPKIIRMVDDRLTKRRDKKSRGRTD